MKKPLDLEHRRSPVRVPAASGLVQRKCACGESLSLHDECSDCRAGRLGLRQRELDRSFGPTIATSDRFADPSLGHHFNDVPIHSSPSLSDPLSDNGGGTTTPTADGGGGGASCPNMKTVSLDFTGLRDSSGDPLADLAFANTIFAPCCVNFAMASGRTASIDQSDLWLGGDTVMERSTGGCGSGNATTEEIDTYQGAEQDFGLSGRVRVFYVESSNPRDRGRAVPPSCATGPAAAIPNMLMVTNSAARRTLAHELGHILLDPGSHGMPSNNLMHITNTATGNDLTPAQCATIFANA